MTHIFRSFFSNKEFSLVTTRYIMLLTINLIAGLFGAFYCIVAIFEENLVISLLNGCMAIIFCSTLWYAYKHPKSPNTYMFTLFVCTLFFLYLYITGGSKGSGHIWSLIVPIGAYLLAGRKKGTLVSFSFLFIIIIISVIESYYDFSFIHLPETSYSIRILSVFFLQTIIAFSYEYTTDKANTEIQNKDFLLTNITNNLPGMIYQFKVMPDGRSMFPYASETVHNLFEVYSNDIQYDATPILQRIHPADYERIMTSIQESKETLQQWEQEFRCILPQKGIRWIHGISLPQKLQDGSIIWNGQLRDITAHKIYEEKFSAVFDAMNEMVVIHSLVFDNSGKPIDYIITDCNNAFIKNTGLHKEYVIGKRATEVYKTPVAPYLKEYVEVALNNSSYSFTTYYEPMQKHFSISVISHRLHEFVTITTDITKQKNEELQIKQLQEQMELAIEGSNDGIWDWNILTDELYISPRWKQMLGYEDHELKNHVSSFINLIYEADAEKITQYIQLYLKGNISKYEIDFRMKHKEGGYRWIFAKGAALRDSEGKPYRMAGSHTDITNLKNQQETLIQEQKFLEALLEAIPIPVFYKDKNLRYSGFNKAFYEFFRYKKEELLGKTVFEIYQTELAEIYNSKDIELLNSSGIQIYESSVKHSDNSISDVIFYKSTFTDSNNNISGIIGAILDITEKNKIEQRFRKMFNTMNSGIAIYKPINNGEDFEFIDFNTAAEQITHSSKETIIGSTLLREFPNMKQSKLFDALQEITRTGTDIYIPPFYYKDNKREGWRENYIFKLSTGEIVAMFTDVTDKKNAEIIIRQERERLQNIIAGTNTATWEWNIETGETIFNERWAEIIGYSLEDITPTSIETWKHFTHPDDIEKSNIILQKHFKGELEFYECECRMYHKNGSIVWVIDRGKVIEWTNEGKPLLMSGTHQDITAKKLVEEQLRASQQEFKNLFEKSPASIILHDIHTGEVIHANEAALNSYGVETLKELQENMFRVEPPYSHSDALEKIKQTLEIGLNSFEWKSRKINGEYFWQLVTLNTFIYQERLCVIATAIDITKEHNNAHLLSLTSNVLQILNQPIELQVILQQTIEIIQEKLECSAIGIRLEHNGDYPFIVSKGFSEEFLLQENSITLKNDDGSIVVNSNNTPCLECTCGLIISGNYPKNNTLYSEYGSFYTKMSNSLLTIDPKDDIRINPRNKCIHMGYKTFALIPIKYNSKAIGLLHIASEKHQYLSNQIIQSLEILVTHISETIIRKTMEEEMVLAKDKAEEANKTKSMFLANMSHEIRTPLNAIVGFSDILHNSSLNQKQKEYSEIIHISSKTLLDLVNDILDFSKIEAGKLDLHYEKTNIIEVIENIVDIVKHKLKDSHIELITNISPQTPHNVIIDPLRIRQVLLNLLNNAIKFTHKGSIEIQILFENKENNKGLYTFSIQDTGIGIPTDKQKQIFEAFTQADNSTTRLYGGTGLGLSISSNIIQKMGSHIELQSEPNIGSNFSFTLELDYIPNDLKEYKFPKKIHKILVIDDNIRIHAYMQEFFAFYDIQCDCSIDGLSGAKLAEKNSYDILIVDYNMPYIDGMQTIESICKLKKDIVPHCIVMITDEQTDEIKSKLQQFPKISIIQKPVKNSEIIQTIEHLYTKQQKAIEIETQPTETNIEGTYNILIVDDNAFNLVLAQTIVQQNIPNAQIFQAVNGLDALEKFKSQHFDLVLMDIQMPVMNGYVAAQKIREFEQTIGTHTPIIAISAGTISGEKEKSIEAGMDNYLPKPIESSEIKKLFELYLEHTTSLKEKKEIETNNESIILKQSKHFDVDMAFEKYANKEFINELVSMALESLPEYIKQLQQAVKEVNNEQIRFNVHTIKGIARGIYFNILYDLCIIIEQDKQADIEKLKQYARNISQEFEYLQKHVKQI